MTGSNDILQGSSVQGQHLEGITINCKLWHLLDSGRNGRLLLSLLTEGFFPFNLPTPALLQCPSIYWDIFIHVFSRNPGFAVFVRWVWSSVKTFQSVLMLPLCVRGSHPRVLEAPGMCKSSPCGSHSLLPSSSISNYWYPHSSSLGLTQEAEEMKLRFPSWNSHQDKTASFISNSKLG